MSRNKWIAVVAIISILTVAFLWGGDYGKTSPQSAIEDGATLADADSDEPGKVKDNKALIEDEGKSAKDDANASSEQDSTIMTEQGEQNLAPSATVTPVAETGATDSVESTDRPVSSPSATVTSTPSSWAEGNSNGNGNNSSSKPSPTTNTQANGVQPKPTTKPSVEGNKPDTNSDAEVKPKPVEWQDTTVNIDKPLYVTLSVSAATILDNLSLLDESKLEVLPKDGIIYAAKKVVFYEGETVFDVLLREMKSNKIHMEFEMTPLYKSNYIEGIHNLYEFDCGELSGWMYSVNNWFPNYGSSRYALQDGDVVEWLYTCDLGRDVGGYVAPAGGS